MTDATTQATHRVDRLWPEPAFDLTLDEAMAAFDLPPAPRGRPLVAVNMVTSIDGRAQLHGTAEGLGSRADRRLMRLYRAAFDAVGSGAGTVRTTGVWLRVGGELEARRRASGRSPNPVGVVIAGEEPIPADAGWFGGDEPRVLVVGRENPLSEVPPGTELLRAPDPLPDPAWVLAELAGRGIGSLLLEGGPRLNAAFLAAGLIDEVYWTIGPHLLGTDALPMVTPTRPDDADPIPAHLVSVHRHGDELFLRYRVADAAGWPMPPEARG